MATTLSHDKNIKACLLSGVAQRMEAGRKIGLISASASLTWLFWKAFDDGPRHCEPWSSDERRTPEQAHLPLLTSTPHQCEDVGASTDLE
ncbi:hypothetical protein TNCV_1391111 [Trichonephila clavipes]|nr:hypothetical protein TNCV_1391111 [Trichonephila clavipes]